MTVKNKLTREQKRYRRRVAALKKAAFICASHPGIGSSQDVIDALRAFRGRYAGEKTQTGWRWV